MQSTNETLLLRPPILKGKKSKLNSSLNASKEQLDLLRNSSNERSIFE